MKKQRVFLMLVSIVIVPVLLWSIYDWMFIEQAPRYFVEKPSRLLLLLAIVAVGTPVGLGCLALPDPWKRRVKVTVIGFTAAAMSLMAVLMVSMLMCFARAALAEGHLWLIAGTALLSAANAGLFWWAFVRAWKGKPV